MLNKIVASNELERLRALDGMVYDEAAEAEKNQAPTVIFDYLTHYPLDLLKECFASTRKASLDVLFAHDKRANLYIFLETKKDLYQLHAILPDSSIVYGGE